MVALKLERNLLNYDESLYDEIKPLFDRFSVVRSSSLRAMTLQCAPRVKNLRVAGSVPEAPHVASCSQETLVESVRRFSREAAAAERQRISGRPPLHRVKRPAVRRQTQDSGAESGEPEEEDELASAGAAGEATEGCEDELAGLGWHKRAADIWPPLSVSAWRRRRALRVRGRPPPVPVEAPFERGPVVDP